MIRGYVRATSETVSAETQINDLQIKEGVMKDLITVEEGSECHLLKTMDLKSGDKLVVWRLDVLGFFTRDLIHYLLDLHQRGIFIKSLQDNIDTSLSQHETKAFYKGINAGSDNEMAIRRSKIKVGIKSARDAGRKATRPRIIDEEKEVEIRKMIAEGHNKAEICRRLHINPKTFYNWERKNYRI